MQKYTRHTYLAFKSLNSFWFGLASLVLIIILAACGSSSTGSTSTPPASGGTTPTTATGGSTPTASSSGNTMNVSISTDSSGSFAFSPAAITITVGTTVVWTNTTSAPHTVTSDDGKTFDSNLSTPIAASGGTFKFTFNTPGTYTYHCQIHPYMKATVIVH